MRLNQSLKKIFTLYKFALIGAVASSVHITIFLIFYHRFRFPFLVSNTASFLIAFSVSFLGNYHWTFPKNNEATAALIKFSIVAILTFFVNSSLLWLFFYTLEFQVMWSYLIAIFASTMFSFVLSRSWAFANK